MTGITIGQSSKESQSIKSVRFDGLKPGPHLLVLGAVHGDETCGPLGIIRVIEEFEAQVRTLQKGSVTFVPVCNPRAFHQGVRFCERNLNRALYVKEQPRAYEDWIDRILCRVLDEADVLIDLHSYASKGSAFCFLGTSSEKEIALCRSLGINDFVYGWADAFGKVLADPRDGMGTVEYARSKGALATTVECGHHNNADAPDIAYQVICAGLTHLGLCAGQRPVVSDQRFVKMHSVFFKDQEGALEQHWCHYDQVKAGEILARYSSGEMIVAPTDGYIVLPKLTAPIGGEWFYFGVATDCPSSVG